MASNKRIALYDYIEVDGVDLSNFARSVAFASDDDQIDASGFNATGSDETLAGKRVKTITIEFMMSRAENEVHQTLYPLHRDKTLFDLEWRANVNAGASATNPALRGTVNLPSWAEGATRGDLEVTSLTFVSQGDDGLEYYAT